ncbi:MAG: hypothetical protein IAF08_01950, partial [Rhizobacter sp.]|nr:hypothetical protein [Chlorobiales bacterium]
MKKVSMLLAALFIAATAQAQNVPDANFRAQLSSFYGITFDGSNNITNPATAAALTSMNVGSRSIASLTGIEAFTGLQQLFCQNNLLTNLNVSANTALTTLDCYGNQLDSLNLTANTALAQLSCFGNNLTSLDLSANTVLEDLDCVNNQLTSLILPTGTLLEELYCSSNQLTNLDISKNPALREIELSNNFALTSVLVWVLPFPPASVISFTANNVPAVFSLPGWAFKTIALGVTFTSVAAASAANFLTVGEGGSIYASTDSGNTWTAQPQSVSTADLTGLIVSENFLPLTAAKGNSVSSTNGFGSAVAVGVGGTILRSADGGSSWQSVNTSGNSNTLNAIDGAGGSTASALRGSSKGNESQSASGTLSTQGFGSAVAVGVGGTILRSADGVAWSSVASGTGSE